MSRVDHVQICLKGTHSRMLECEAHLYITLARVVVRHSRKPVHQIRIPHPPDLQLRRLKSRRQPKAETSSPKQMMKYC